MNKLQQTLEKGREEFLQRANFVEVGGGEHRAYTYDIGNLEDLLQSHQQDILNAVIAEVEGMKKISPYKPKDREFYNDKHRECGYQFALTDVVDKLSTLTK